MRRLRAAALAALALAACMAAPAQVTVSGPGSVGVGQMSGGSIHIGITQAQLEAAFKARGAEQLKLLRDIAAKLNALAARQGAAGPAPPQGDAFSVAVVHGFLATVVGKRVPEADWPRVLHEIASRYLELGARITATPVTSERIEALVAQAEEARRAGDLARADTLLEEAEKHAIADAAPLKERARESNRQAAGLLASRASLALARLEREQAARLLQRAFEQRADDVSPESFWWLVEAGDAWRVLGNSERMLALRLHAQRVAARELAADPASDVWQRHLSVSHGLVGEARQAQGDLGAALRSYEAGMTLARRLAAADPAHRQWQHDLSVFHEKMGAVQQAQVKLGDALKSYQAAMAIREKLVAADPADKQWLHDLSINHRQVGDILLARGELDDALRSYRAAMAIALELSAADPGNSQWLRSLSTSHTKIGNTLQDRGELGDALQSHLAALAIREKVAAADPGNSQWQDDLSVSHIRIGDIRLARGELGAALESLQAALAIHQKLAAADPGNSRWQHGLFASHTKIGDIRRAQAEPDAALQRYRAALAITRKLTDADPSNSLHLRDLAVLCWKIGTLAAPAHGKAERSAALQAGLRVLVALEDRGALAPPDAGLPAMFRKAIEELN